MERALYLFHVQRLQPSANNARGIRILGKAHVQQWLNMLMPNLFIQKAPNALGMMDACFVRRYECPLRVGFSRWRQAEIGQKRTSDCVRGKKAFGKIWSAKPQAIWKSALDRIDGTKNWSIRGV